MINGLNCRVEFCIFCSRIPLQHALFYPIGWQFSNAEIMNAVLLNICREMSDIRNFLEKVYIRLWIDNRYFDVNVD
jgi:hypothetical protein